MHSAGMPQVACCWTACHWEKTMKVSAAAISSPIASAVLPNGDHLELIRKGKNSTSLLRWSGDRATKCPEFKFGWRRFLPAAIGKAGASGITLAAGVSNYKSTADLYNRIAGIFQSTRAVERSNAEMATCIIFATYFADCLEPAPRAIVTGIDPWDMVQVLRLFDYLCRHAITTALFEPRNFRNLPAGCSPTFLVGDPRPSSTLLKLLDVTQYFRFGMARSRTIVNRRFSAVILDSDGEMNDTVPDTFCRINATPRMGTRPALLGPKALQKIAETFQPQLLLYRLRNRSQVARQTFDPSSLSGSTRALGSVLGSCFPDSTELQERVVQLLTPQDEERRLDQVRCASAVVIEALLIACHEQQTSVHVGEIAAVANGILRVRGDGYQLEARKVGSILRSFSLEQRRDSRGYGFLLSTACKRRIHQLGRSMDVPFLRGDIKKCDLCKESSA
jgi:hypothetical protein